MSKKSALSTILLIILILLAFYLNYREKPTVIEETPTVRQEMPPYQPHPCFDMEGNETQCKG